MTDLVFRRWGIDDEPTELIDYSLALAEQRRLHADVAAGNQPNTVIFLQHPSVYTAGRSAKPQDRPFDGTPVIDVDRGGQITWHGPGQLVGYPIIKLPEGIYVVDYVRRLEEALIRTANQYDLDAVRIKGRTGVWLPASEGRPERKLVAIGVRVAKRTTMHGFAWNVLDDLRAFSNIVPCGISDAGVTSLQKEMKNPPSLAQVASDLAVHLQELLGRFGPFETVMQEHIVTEPAIPAELNIQQLNS